MSDLLFDVEYACRYVEAIGAGRCRSTIYAIGGLSTLEMLLNAMVVPELSAPCVIGNRVVEDCVWVLWAEGQFIVAPSAAAVETGWRPAFTPRELAELTRVYAGIVADTDAPRVAALLAGYPRVVATRLARVAVRVLGEAEAKTWIYEPPSLRDIVAHRRKIRSLGDAAQLLISVLVGSLPYGTAYCSDDYAHLWYAALNRRVDILADILVIYAVAYTPSHHLQPRTTLHRVPDIIETGTLRDVARMVVEARSRNPERIACANRLLGELRVSVPQIAWRRNIAW